MGGEFFGKYNGYWHGSMPVAGGDLAPGQAAEQQRVIAQRRHDARLVPRLQTAQRRPPARAV